MKGFSRQRHDVLIASIVGMGFLFMMGGCSSRLHTTVMSGSHPVESSAVLANEPMVAPIAKANVPSAPIEEPKGLPMFDIPVEEPARPTIHEAKPREIFAASPAAGKDVQSSGVPGTSSIIPEPSLAPLMESEVTQAVPSSSPGSSEVSGIAPFLIEPELPALPTIQKEVASPQEQELVAKVVPEDVENVHPVPEVPIVQESEPTSKPIEVAKLISPSTENVEKILEPIKDVFFDYDRFAIRTDAAKALKGNAPSLVASLGEMSLVIEGHCDERGTSSYNMVLGERRAQAVKEYLVDLGVPADKMQTVSYGKERPFCTDQTQECWQENRRGHFVLK